MFSSYFLLLKALGFSPGVFNFINAECRMQNGVQGFGNEEVIHRYFSAKR